MTREQSVTPSSKPNPQAGGSEAFPKAKRLLRRTEFRQVYEHGFKVSCSCFVAFCWNSGLEDGPKVGFTTPRALGKAVVRNRMRRRVRETIRRSLNRLHPEWRIVWNLRRGALTAPQAVLHSEVEKVFTRCNG